MATYYVSPDGDDSDGTTWAKAKNSITDGFALLSPTGGDTVYVKGGEIYRETATTTKNGAAGNRHVVYMDATGDGTTRSRLPEYQARVYGSVNTGNGSYKWTISSVASNLFSNSSLEDFAGTSNDSVTDNWTSWTEETTGDAYIDASTEADVGDYSAKLYKGTGNASIVYYNVPLTPGTQYTLRFRGLSDGTGTGSAYINYTYGGNTYWLQDNLTYSTTANYTINGQGVDIAATDVAWTTYSLTFTASTSNTDTPQNYNFYFRTATNNASVYYDNLSLAPASPTGAIYYLEAIGGGDPSLTEPVGIVSNDIYSDDISPGEVTVISEGTTIASLADHQWKWGDSDALGYSTVYFHDESGDPDVTGITLEIPQRNNALQLDMSYYSIYGGIYRYALKHGIETTSTNPGVFNYLYNTWTEYNNWHGLSANATDTYAYGCVSVNNNSKGFQAHNSTPVANPDLHVYLYNCTAYNNLYNYVVYSKMHLRNCISYNGILGEFYKQVADAGNVIDPDEQYCIWYSTATGDRNWKAQGADTLPDTHATSIVANPCLRSATNFRLHPLSPAINAGTDVGITLDYAGNGIVAAPDIGAYEYQPAVFTYGWGANWRRRTIYDCFYVDSGLSMLYSGEPTSDIFGLDHLAGATVSLLVDGVVHPDALVNEYGGVSLEFSGTTIHAGLPYTATYRSVNLEGGSRMGTAIGQIKRIIKVILNLYNTSGGQIGFDDSDLQDIQIPSWKTGTSLFTGDVPMLFRHGYDTEAYIQVTQADPLPMTILNVIPVFDTREK